MRLSSLSLVGSLSLVSSLFLVGPARDFNPLESAPCRAHQKKDPRRSDGGPKKNRGASQRMTIRPGE